MITNLVRGFCMALADSVPGVSGGTVAFLMGFYDRFIASIDNALHGTRTERGAALRFLGKLGAGWLVGIALAAFTLSSLFEAHPYAVSSLFLGLVACSIPLVLHRERQTLRGQLKFAPLALIGFALVAAISLAGPVVGGAVNLAAGALTVPSALYVLVAAMMAVSAMVLPGVSGSTLLLVFGLYAPIMGAVRGLLTFDLAFVPVLLVFAVGVALGLLLFSRVIRRCLEHYRAQTVFFVTGMMAASLIAVARGPLTLAEPMPAMDLFSFDLGYFMLGIGLVAGLRWLRRSAVRAGGMRPLLAEMRQSAAAKGSAVVAFAKRTWQRTWTVVAAKPAARVLACALVAASLLEAVSDRMRGTSGRRVNARGVLMPTFGRKVAGEHSMVNTRL